MQDDQHNTASTTSQLDDQNLLDQDGEGELQMELDLSGDQELLGELRTGNYPGSPRHEFMEKLEELARELEDKGMRPEVIKQVLVNVEEEYRQGRIKVIPTGGTNNGI